MKAIRYTLFVIDQSDEAAEDQHNFSASIHPEGKIGTVIGGIGLGTTANEAAAEALRLTRLS